MTSRFRNGWESSTWQIRRLDGNSGKGGPAPIVASALVDQMPGCAKSTFRAANAWPGGFRAGRRCLPEFSPGRRGNWRLRRRSTGGSGWSPPLQGEAAGPINAIVEMYWHGQRQTVRRILGSTNQVASGRRGGRPGGNWPPRQDQRLENDACTIAPFSDSA